MQALRFTHWQRPAELVETAIPEPGPGQVVIKIGGAGACHSDLHIMEEWPDGLMPWRLPFTLGHENAGWVHALGAGVSGFAIGDAVLVYGPWGCGRCRPCRLGRENYCENAAEIGALGGGLGLDGGMAEYMLVPSARLLIPLGELAPSQVAPLADAALTPYHAIQTSRTRLPEGGHAVVIGVGGLGQMAIQLLRATTAAHVTALDKDPEQLELARRLGADAAFRSDDDAIAAIRKQTGGAHVVFDMVGSDATLGLGAKVLRAEGRLVIVGLGGGTLPVTFLGVPFGAEVATSYWGTVPELMELVELVRARRIRLEVETFPLDRALEAYGKLRRGEIRGRAVIVPSR